MVVQDHFAVLKSMYSRFDGYDNDILYIEVVKIVFVDEFKAGNASQFKGRLYLCTKDQTNADCLDGRWYAQVQRVTFEAETIICTFPGLLGNNRLPRNARDAVIAQQMFHGCRQCLK
jgi:hypothetical protein